MNWCRFLGCRRRQKRPHLRHDPKLEAAHERLRVVNDRAARLTYKWGRDDWPEMVSDIYRGERR